MIFSTTFSHIGNQYLSARKFYSNIYPYLKDTTTAKDSLNKCYPDFELSNLIVRSDLLILNVGIQTDDTVRCRRSIEKYKKITESICRPEKNIA